MPKTVQPTTSGAPDSGDREAFRHFGDGFAGKLVAARLQGYDSGSLSYIDVAVDGTGQLKSAASGGGGAVTVADGADVAQGATSDVAWVSGGGSLIAISKAEHAKLEAIRALLAGTLTVNTGLTDTQLRASAVPVSGTFWQATQPVSAASLPLPAGAAQEHVTAAGFHSVRLTDGAAFYDGRDITDRAARLVGVVDTELPAAAALGDAAANPTVPATGSFGMVWNGATWDREPLVRKVQGDVAAAAVDSGNPQKIGGKISSAAPGAGTAGNRVDGWFGVNGQLIIGTGPATAGDGASLAGTIPDSSGTNRALAVAPSLFNGTNVDRERGNWNTTTGDTGAKTTNFLGATQTNYNARGALITILLGAVSGTITTFQTGLQASFDGGTTWYSITALGANITTPASGNTIVWNIYPGNLAVTPAAAGGGVAPTQWNQAGIALPRTWRIAATIAGTTPSITITSVNVNYIV